MENSLGFCCEDRKLQGSNLRSQEQFRLKKNPRLFSKNTLLDDLQIEPHQ